MSELTWAFSPLGTYALKVHSGSVSGGRVRFFDLQGTVLVRNNVYRVIGTESNVIVGSQANPTNPGFKLVDGSISVVVFERLQSGYYANPTFENASTRTIVILHSLNVSGNMTGTGDVFLEDVSSNGCNLHLI